jgi:hypothetical protein
VLRADTAAMGGDLIEKPGGEGSEEAFRRRVVFG